MADKKLLIVFSKRIAIALRKKGHKIVKTEVNFHYPQFDVYFFENTPSLMRDYLEVKKK